MIEDENGIIILLNSVFTIVNGKKIVICYYSGSISDFI